ncbi:metal-dependent hydrolase [Qipengyuania zhejiangensis]|uniref:metal-dependent hydrolase n=1 Tax=Qipengyuania zhejiangensis TaxID=3077782 RepID=UPI002D773026|nr:metal-dependent hydrolase [Qipengyuania sp. Z2]
MDNLTHSLVGALIGQAGLKKKTGLAMPALIIGANLPDVDAACLFWLDGQEHLGFRRGITHGPPALVLLPLVLAALLYGYDRWQAKRGKRPEGRLPVSFKWLFLLSFLGCLTHPALDWLNVYGIRLLEPFSSEWFHGDTLFIIDLWLWAVMGFATWFSLRRERRGSDWTRPARLALLASAFYILANGLITRDAERMTLNDGQYSETIASPVPFAFWQRELIFVQADGRPAIMPGYAGPSNDSPKIVKPWSIPLSFCRLDAVAAVDPEARAFLFWSRAPFIEKIGEGMFVLRDARFYDPLARDRFSVALPASACAFPK